MILNENQLLIKTESLFLNEGIIFRKDKMNFLNTLMPECGKNFCFYLYFNDIETNLNFNNSSLKYFRNIEYVDIIDLCYTDLEKYLNIDMNKFIKNYSKILDKTIYASEDKLDMDALYGLLYDVTDFIINYYSNIDNTTLYIFRINSDYTFLIKDYLVNYPVIVEDLSLVKLLSYTRGSNEYKRGAYNDYYLSKEFKDMVKPIKTKLNPNIYDHKKLNKLTLYHISPDPNIKEMIPKVTDFYMTGENLVTPRISFAQTINGCILARYFSSEFNPDQIRLYIYEPIITKNSKGYKPRVNFIPDCKETGEICLLTKTKVKKTGYLDLRMKLDEDNLCSVIYKLNTEKEWKYLEDLNGNVVTFKHYNHLDKI